MKTLICKQCGTAFDWGGTRFEKLKCNECSDNKTRKNILSIMKTSWTKYGSRKMGYRKNPNEWICQSCGKDQIKELPGFNLPIDDSMKVFIKICSNCQNIVNNHEVDYKGLIDIVRA